MQINEMLVALGVPVGAFMMSVAIVALVGFYKDRERKLRHETIRLALEKGQPLPAELLAPPAAPRNELASGIRLVFLGVGLGVFLGLILPARPFWAAGLILVFLGLGKMVAHAITSRAPPPTPGSPAP